jgi:branched-chain amino acid transport system substrate-binding protein
MMIGKVAALGAVLAAFAMAGPARAADPVKIGVLYPLTGNAASAGAAAKDAVELGAEIVNGAHPELKGLPLAEAAGLSRLGGAKIVLLSADHQGNPSVGQSQTLRLITEDHVIALLGAYHSSVSMTATAVAERQGVPFLVGDSVALAITQRGFKWVFRTGPIASDFAVAYTKFLLDQKQAGRKIGSIAIVNENTEYGTSVSGSIAEAAKQAGLAVAAQIPYSANSADVCSPIRRSCRRSARSPRG